MDKRGIFGMDTVSAVIIALLTIAVIAIATFLAVSTLRDTAETTETLFTVNAVNQTLTSVDEVGEYVNATLRNCKATTNEILNETNFLIPASNYTTGQCQIRFTAGAAAVYNTTNWKWSGTYTYNSPQVNQISGNLTIGVVNFVKQAPTFFTLLGVVVLILIIAIVIIAVTRFESGGMSIGAGRSSGSSDLL